MLGDFDAPAGSARGEYFHQDLWAARKIHAARPAGHVDVGSRIDGFISHLLVFMPVTVIDVRPLDDAVDGLTFIAADATTLDRFNDESIGSLSSLHAIEHFGLGRYGDPIDPNACFNAMRSLRRVLRPGGRLYFGVPIGRERLEFNAHRVFAPSTILRSLAPLRLLSFAAVNSEGRLTSDSNPSDWENVEYGCGLFEFTK
jgi:SAM-dependent methyltransferase